MLSVSSTVRCFFLFLFIIAGIALAAQENAPFSRYGLGDVYPAQHIASRGMGGLSAAFQNLQAINTINPATYSALQFIDLGKGVKGGLVTYDVGISIDSRTLRSAVPADKFNSVNFIPSYIQIGIPLNKKLLRSTGIVVGLRPATKINYSVDEKKRTNIDSMQTIYGGDGGLNQAFIGLGKRWNHFSAGVNFGYEFGQKNISTKISFLNDSVFYYQSNSTDSAHFGGLFVNPGLFGSIKLKEITNSITKNSETYLLNLGASATLKQHLEATKSLNRQTFTYGPSGELVQIDSVFKQSGISGTIEMPLNYTAGFMFTKVIGNAYTSVNKWSFGADYSAALWENYRYFGLPDRINNSWKISVGGEFTPDPLAGKTFFSRTTYRAGFYAGKNYINADGNGYNEKALTLGGSFNLRKFRAYDHQYTLINTAIEIGKRGSAVNNITETFFKFSVGLSLSDLWFISRKYE